jgi:hypothetical protein
VGLTQGLFALTKKYGEGFAFPTPHPGYGLILLRIAVRRS